MPRTKVSRSFGEWISYAKELEAERDALREALEAALPWIGVREDNRGHWCPPSVVDDARAALERPE